jgi:chloride channel protein, CIC family
MTVTDQRALGGRQRRSSWQRVAALLSPHSLRNSEPALTILCAPLGAGVGLVVVALHALVNELHVIDFDLLSSPYLSTGSGIDHTRLLVVPALGGLILGLLTLLVRRFRPREIVDPVEANAIYGGRMSLVDSLYLAFVTLISNAAGASVGMEAAYTQIGSGLLSTAGQSLRLRRNDLRVFTAAGSAAAIAAAFNAPLAGAFYAYELILGSYSPAALAQVALASLTGTLVMRGTLGVDPIYLVEAPPLAIHHWEYPLFGLVGVAAAGLGILTMKLVTWHEAKLRHLPTPDWLRPAIGGIALTGLAMAYPQVLGSGHGGIQGLFRATPELSVVAGLLVAKVIASALCIGAGFRGGLFSSSLFMGCLFGAAFAQILGLFMPWGVDHRLEFMLVGMGAVAASIVGAPLTMVLLVLEVTGDFQIALGVLAGVVTAATITRYTFGYSFSTWRFHQRGVGIRGGFDIGWVADLTVGKLMRADAKTVPEGTSLLRLREIIPLGSRTLAFAVDSEGRYAGLIDIAIAHDPELDDAAAGLVASDLAMDRQVFLLPRQDVRTALQRFAETEMEALPVLSDSTERHVIGFLTEAYTARRYAEELERQRSAELGHRDLFSVRPPVKSGEQQPFDS